MTWIWTMPSHTQTKTLTIMLHEGLSYIDTAQHTSSWIEKLNNTVKKYPNMDAQKAFLSINKQCSRKKWYLESQAPRTENCDVHWNLARESILRAATEYWSFFASILWYWATSWENLFMPYANNKGADQPAHPHSLISAFVIRCLDSIIPLVSISKISRL